MKKRFTAKIYEIHAQPSIKDSTSTSTDLDLHAAYQYKLTVYNCTQGMKDKMRYFTCLTKSSAIIRRSFSKVVQNTGKLHLHYHVGSSRQLV